jgi:hypothetical protein
VTATFGLPSAGVAPRSTRVIAIRSQRTLVHYACNPPTAPPGDEPRHGCAPRVQAGSRTHVAGP